MDKILLRGLTFYGRHGCLNAERELGQKFVVDVEAELDLRAACQSDNLEDSLDYVSLYNAARDIIEGPSAHLLEALAGRIAEFVLQDARVQSVRVQIRKPHIALPVALDFLGVEIYRTRADMASP